MVGSSEVPHFSSPSGRRPPGFARKPDNAGKQHRLAGTIRLPREAATRRSAIGSRSLDPSRVSRYDISHHDTWAESMGSSKDQHSRLGWVELHILLALADADLHGYAIMQKLS